MMSDAIKNFSTQFLFVPTLVNAKTIRAYKRYILLGMGGSHLAADLALVARPDIALTIHSDYGLPALPPSDIRRSLIIASSYSGNTEEVIDGLLKAKKQKLPIVVIAVGGNLITRAKKYGLPYIQLPDTGIQPRSALGFSLVALLFIMNDTANLRLLKQLAKTLTPASLEGAGKELAHQLQDRVPVIYTSARNQAIGYNWKIKMNETGKIPAFYNVLPELNHNEMTGFDIQENSKHLAERFIFLFIRDTKDHPRVAKRMDILEKLYRDRALPVVSLPLEGKNVFEKMFRSLLIADWAAVHIASHYGLESEQVPMVEEFKRLMK